MAEYLVQDASLETVADAIREKGGTSAALSFPDGFAEAIAAIESGGAQMATGTVTASSSTKSFTLTPGFKVSYFMMVRIITSSSATAGLGGILYDGKNFRGYYRASASYTSATITTNDETEFSFSLSGSVGSDTWAWIAIGE